MLTKSHKKGEVRSVPSWTRETRVPTSENSPELHTLVARPRTALSAASLGAHYEHVMLSTLYMLWRRRWLLLIGPIIGAFIGAASLYLIKKSYVAEAVIQFNFAREDRGRQSPPGAAMDAAILVEGEARLIRSLSMARRVAQRLKLDDDPGYTTPGFLARLQGMITPAPASTTRNSALERAAQNLARQLKVVNDPRSYLINVSVTSNSPEWSATLANAAAVEYLNLRIVQKLRDDEGSARSALSDLRNTYGERHPLVERARAVLEASEKRIRDQEHLVATRPDEVVPLPGQSYLAAEPVWLAVGPRPVPVMALSLLGGIFASLGLAFLLERRDTSLHSERDVETATGVRCIAMVPRPRGGAREEISAAEEREAFRALFLSAGLSGRPDTPQVVMVSTAVPVSGQSQFVHRLTDTLAVGSQRILHLDFAPKRPHGAVAQPDDAVALEDVLLEAKALDKILASDAARSVYSLRRRTGPSGFDGPLKNVSALPAALDGLIAAAKSKFQFIVIETPPTLLWSESSYLGRLADINLHVSGWNETPRESVVAALELLKRHDVHVDGIVLTDVDLDAYPSFATGDRTYYASRYRRMRSNS